MSDLKGADYLRRKLARKRTRVQLRYKYYDQKSSPKDFDTIPANLRWLRTQTGWCTKAVDSLANRLQFRGFRNDIYNLTDIYMMNNMDILPAAAIRSALIGSCSFLYISPDEAGNPRLQVIDAGNATGEIDPITNLLTEGLAVLSRDSETGKPLVTAYFTPEATEITDQYGATEVYEHSVGHPLLVPIINRPDDVRPFGHSQISRACMAYSDSASRTIRQMEVSAEYYSFPQKYVTGLSQDAEKMDKWRATMSSFLAFYRDDDGGAPTVGQFSQQSMTPYSDELRTIAALFAGETGLTLDDLGFVTDNPSSAEAIKAAHENLRLMARAAQRSFGSGFLNAGFLAACLRDDTPYNRDRFYQTEPIWAPVFEPDAAALASIGDGVGKLNQSVPGFVGRTMLEELTGIQSAEVTA